MFLFALFIGRYGKVGKSLLLVAFFLLAFKYYFMTPLHSLPATATKITRLLIFLLAMISASMVAQTPVATPRTIRVVVDNAYAPYSFQSDDGKLQGILIDQWQAWEKKTQIKTEIQALDWGEALRRMRAGEFDVIDSIVETSERRAYFDFTPAYTKIEASIYFRKDISGISDLASLKGFPVGVKTGDQHIDQLKANGVTTVIPLQNNEAIIEAAKQHKINVFVVDDPSALYLLNKAGIEDEFRHSPPVFRDDLRRAVRKGDAAMLRMVSEGFAAIDAGELKQIDEKWFGRTINRYGRYLTYAGYAAALALLLIAGLVGWNRTLRKRIAQRTAELGESEQRFRQIAENIREVFWMSTGDFGARRFTMLYISPAYESVWGRTCESLYRDPRSFIDAIHPEDRARVVDVNERDQEQGFEIEYRVVRPDGSMRWIRDRGFPIKDAAGRFYRLTGIAEDITERKQAEDRLRLVVDTIPAMVFTALPDGSVDFVNQRWLQYLGLSMEDVEGWGWAPTIHLEDRERSINHWRLTIAAGQSAENELRVRRADGVYRWILGRFVPLRDESGQIIKWYGVSTDIDDRKRAEDALRRSEDRLRLVIDTIPTMVWSLQPDGAIDFVNQRWMDYTGLSLDEAIAEPTGIMHPEDLPGAMAEWGANMAAEEPFEGEIRLRRADGEYRWFLVRTDPLHDEQGNLVKWYGVSIDIEDRKQAEEKLKQSEGQLAEAQRLAHVGSFEWDLSSNAVSWSDELYRIFGLQTGEITVADDAMSFIHPEDRDLVLITVKSSIKNKEPYNFYYRILRSDGNERILHSRGQPKSDENGEPIRVFGATQDVTELKQAEEKLRASSEQLRALSARLQLAREEEGTRIAREIHDELGSALTSLKWVLEGMENTLSDPKSGRELASMREKAKTMTRLVDGTIDVLRRISAELRPGVLDDLGLVSAIEWQARQFHDRTGIAVHCDCSLDDVDLNHEQSTAVFRILQEALTNVLRHAQATRIDIRAAEADGEFMLTISDNGKGISENETSGLQSLGLLGMRERAMLIRGKIDIAGVEGKGTAITLTVPIGRAGGSSAPAND